MVKHGFIYYYDGQVWIDELALYRFSVVSRNTLKSSRTRSDRVFQFLMNPIRSKGEGKWLVCYDTMAENYKKKVRELMYGGADPLLLIRSEVVNGELTAKPEDVHVINTFSFGDGQFIPDQHKAKYIEACKYLYLIARYSKQDIKKAGYSTAKDFYNDLISLIKANKVKLPSAYSKLMQKKREYVEKGAKAVISKKLGNKNSRKVDDLGKAILNELESKPQQLNAVQMTIVYNQIAKEKGMSAICPQTVLNYQNELQTASARKGISVWRNANDFINHRVRPSKPNYLWVGDATPYELYYQAVEIDKNGRQIRKYWLRKVIYVVIDAFNDLIVGFAIGDTENNALAKLAWKNACKNAGCLPYQVKTDNYGLKELRPLYSKIALNDDFFTPSKVGNARDKVIEPLFGRITEQITKFHHNHSGCGITAKKQPNRDYLQKIRHNFPDESGVIDQIAKDMALWNCRKIEKLGGKSLLEQWDEADHSEDRPLTDRLRLDIFGVEHIKLNTLSNKGIVARIEGVERRYMDFSNDTGLKFYKTIGTQYQIYYDPADFSKILVKADSGKKSFVLSENEPTKMAFKDTSEGDRKRLNQKLSFAEMVKSELVLKAADKRREMLQNAGVLSMTENEGIAQAMFSIGGDQKQALYNAQNSLKQLEKPGTDIYDKPELFTGAEKPDNQTQFDDGY